MASGSRFVPSTIDDLPHISSFLQASATEPVPHLSVETLRWKYFDDSACAHGPASLVSKANDAIVAHIALCMTQIRQADAVHPACHFIDWMGTPTHPFAGILIMKSLFHRSTIQYSIGGSDIAQQLFPKLGFEKVCEIPVYGWTTFPRPTLDGVRGSIRSILRSTRWVGRRLLAPPRRPTCDVALERTTDLEKYIPPCFEIFPPSMAFSARTGESLRYLSRCPCADVVTFRVMARGTPIGVAATSVIHSATGTVGRIVDCLLATTDPPVWQAVVSALVHDLRSRGCTSISCLAATPWLQAGCAQAGLRVTGHRNFFVRDPQAAVARASSFYVSFLDGDHGYR